ncbi:MAG: cobyrinate a,c-diamide synthase [Chloroflexota bacterium]
MPDIPRIVIAGTSSGVGKTLITTGLSRALRNRGLRVATFKAGPDFIDPSFLALASGRPCHNLDTWMLPRSAILRIFQEASSQADIAIVEGMMGLFDGRGPVSDEGSTAQLARTLRAPVILVVDAGRASRSIAATVSGFQTFDRRLTFAGVIANQLASGRHAGWVRQALEALAGTTVFGAIERQPSLTVPGRHLGLVQASDLSGVEDTITQAAEVMAEHLDIEAIIDAASLAPPLRPTRPPLTPAHSQRLKIGVARDAAFSFYYAANLELLERHGADIVYFSPLDDESIPAGLSGIYLGGGYPEIHAARLADNTSMKESIRRVSASGLPIYAECGGMLYLARGLTDATGTRHQFVGLLEIEAEMESRRVALGYAEVTALQDSAILAQGTSARGHEFHWSRIREVKTTYTPAYCVTTSDGARDDGFVIGSIVASYVHLHFASQPRLVPRWLAACRAWSKMAMIRSIP